MDEDYINQLADAIYLAEGADKTEHPYGILKKFETTTPREACINTIKHRYADWVNGRFDEDFVKYLGGFYCPVGADNDPQGLNKNWVRNVSALYCDKTSQMLFSLDGNQVSARWLDFFDPQESPVGYGDTREQAMMELLEETE